MRFNIGDIVVLMKPSLHMLKHRGALGKVMDVAKYHSHHPTHYIVKFTCYKIAHIYFIEDIDYMCEPYKIKRRKEWNIQN